MARLTPYRGGYQVESMRNSPPVTDGEKLATSLNGLLARTPTVQFADAAAWATRSPPATRSGPAGRSNSLEIRL